MIIDGVGCDFIKPAAKLLFCALEAGKIFYHLKKYSRGNIFSRLPFEKAMYTIAKDGIIMTAIQPGKGGRVAAGVGYQPAVVSCFTDVVHAKCSPEITGTNYHHNYKCAGSENVAKSEKNLIRFAQVYQPGVWDFFFDNGERFQSVLF